MPVAAVLEAVVPVAAVLEAAVPVAAVPVAVVLEAVAAVAVPRLQDRGASAALLPLHGRPLCHRHRLRAPPPRAPPRARWPRRRMRRPATSPTWRAARGAAPSQSIWRGRRRRPPDRFGGGREGYFVVPQTANGRAVGPTIYVF